jgi:endonuclease YncB( thermonuclease family)
MKLLFLATASAWLLASSPAGAQFVVSGIGQAKDGDSLTVADREIRLFGIDAPEFDQTCQRDGTRWMCGAEAANQLSALVTGKTVRCEQVGTDQYNRMLARCRVGATDVNRTMVALGLAVAYRRYSSDYVSTEASAKGNRFGLWAGQFENPSDYRHLEKTPAQTKSIRHGPGRKAPISSSWAGRAKANCNIKGNRNRKGQWIYHLPDMPYYDQTRPEEIFCTEAEAQAAGYRRAIVR